MVTLAQWAYCLSRWETAVTIWADAKGFFREGLNQVVVFNHQNCRKILHNPAPRPLTHRASGDIVPVKSIKVNISQAGLRERGPISKVGRNTLAIVEASLQRAKAVLPPRRNCGENLN